MADADEIVLRRWQTGDIESLLRYANNRNVWITLRDRFPFPYTRPDAEAWIKLCHPESPITQFAITLRGEAIGGVGLERMGDVYRLTAEIGYWLGEPFWRRGIATAAVIKATAHGFANLGVERLEARVFGSNPASARVLEKAGYTFEGRLSRSVIKDGRMLDSYLYARLR